MKSVICTLFEKSYHQGVAALVNSLYCNDFRGAIYAGYRGKLPSWASLATDNPAIEWTGAKTLQVAEGLQLHFLPVDTHFHFTTYKPYFMLSLIEGIAKDADGIVYFDPDIVVKCDWKYFEKWISYGVGLVHEIVNHDMPPNHPTRIMWHEIINQSGRTVVSKLTSYINAGFCGVSKQHIEFIKTWRDIIDTAIRHHDFDPKTFINLDRTALFCGDQDGLNITAMCCESPLCEVGPQEMDFLHGGYIMSHAVGRDKPWRNKFIRASLSGNRPRSVDKFFWKSVSYPIQLYSKRHIAWKKRSLNFASFIGRFYGRQ